MASGGMPASAAALRARNLDCPSTLSNFLDLVVTGMHLDLAVDFEAEAIEGTVKYTARAQTPSEPSELVLDTRHLEVIRVEANGAVIVGEGIPTLFKGAEDTAPFGRALHIPLGTTIAEGESVECTVTYRTTKQSSAVQFLKAEQTADKEAPFLFTQCQAIHARSLLPCQDSPGVKCTFTSSVRVPAGITALMSALPEGEPVVSEDGAFTTFSFKQPVPVPSYLIAVAAGLLAQRPLAGEETMSVWAEPSIVDASAHEFAETPAFVRAAESIMGPYEWGRYDLLVLPPTFPYGGMENPCLTFVTPTLLAGDRSLADVVAHEICHSWAGNLVTCATWEHFWLNEGATMMAQRLIVAAVSEASSSPHWGAVRGETNFQFDAAGGEEVLNRAVDGFVDRGQSPFTVLVPALDGVDPDDSFSSVPYEKGFLLFDAIRRVVGDRARFLGWFKSWFASFRRRCATSEDLRLHVTAFFASAEGADVASDGLAPIDMSSAIAWDDWFGLEGRAVTSPLEWDDAGIRAGCTALAVKWASGEGSDSSAMDGWSAGQKIRFLDEIVGKASAMRSEGKRIALSTVSRMDSAFAFGESKNCEIAFRWLCLRIAAGDILPSEQGSGCLEDAKLFLRTYGRMKYVRPLFQRLLRDSSSRAAAVELEAELASFYHPICGKVVAGDVALETARDATDALSLTPVGDASSEADAEATDAEAAPEADAEATDAEAAPEADAETTDAEAAPEADAEATDAEAAPEADAEATDAEAAPEAGPRLGASKTAGAAAASSSPDVSRSALTASLRRDQAKIEAKSALSPDEQREAETLAKELAASADSPAAGGAGAGSSLWSGIMSKEISGPAAGMVPMVLAGSIVLCGAALVVFAVRRMSSSE